MKRLALFLFSAVILAAQPVPNRYIIELSTEPTAALAAARHARYSTGDAEVQTRRAAILAEHASAESAVNRLGGTVTHHFDTVLNGIAVTLTPESADRMRQVPGVKGVYPVVRHHIRLDHAVNVHRISQVWQTLAGGPSSSGAGIKIGVLDTGIDIAHPAFQGFTTAVPSGFPVTTNNTEIANTNNKIIVARFYSDSAGQIMNTSSLDLNGHGTSIAMNSAGLSNDPQIPGISALVGVASGAWLGNYKVADDDGASSNVTFLAGLEDALADGMDVVNYSSGSASVNSSDENGAEARAVANAVAAGMLVVTVAGNDPSWGAIESPGVVPAAITVGANENERFFYYAVTIAGFPPVAATLPDAEYGLFSGQTRAPVVDVAAIDGNGYACSALPNNSLLSQVVLIQRGGVGSACTFDTKLGNALNAGATAAIIYDNQDEALFDYTLDVLFDPRADPGLPTITNTGLPMLFVSRADGTTIKQQIGANAGIQGTLDFDGFTPLPRPANIVADFSSGGPTPAGSAKPDLVAVGDYFITADATINNPELPFTYVSGTSVAAPMVTGAVAILKSQRPGLTGPQYRSLIINSAPEFDQYTDGSIAGPVLAGAGMLDMPGALNNNLAAAPTSLNFQSAPASGGGSTSSNQPLAKIAHAQAASVSQSVTLTNVGSASDTFSLTVLSLDNVAVPVTDLGTFSLDPGANKKINVSLSTAGLATGQYHGFLVIHGTQTSVATRVPYFYAVTGTTVNNVNLLMAPEFSSTGFAEQIIFRTVDASGMPLDPAAAPKVTTSNGRARVISVQPIGDIAGTYIANVVIGRADTNGLNTFTIAADGVTQAVYVYIQ
jgi:minor extracellular serine protease Vpr